MAAHVLTMLQERGLIHQFSETGLEAALSAGPMVFYTGFDPTADSLHVGHLLPVMVMAHLQQHGHKPIALVGGGTGLIGDPSWRANERPLLTKEEVAHNVEGIRAQLQRFLDFDGPNAAVMRNNLDWLGQFSLLDFLRDVGKHFTINVMLDKDSVKGRLESREQGISFTEFSYMLLQAADFLHLHDAEGCTFQAGGSDQWGNITAGMELIRRVRGKSAHGLTVPLLTKSDGTKFGKSEGGAVWLDAKRTSPYAFFQFFLNSADADVLRFLKVFTFRPLDEIDALAADLEQHPEQRRPQRVLAHDMTALVHGEHAAQMAERASAILFEGKLDGAGKDVWEFLSTVIPAQRAARSAIEEGSLNLADTLVTLGLAASKSEVRRLLNDGAIAINEQAQRADRPLSPADLQAESAILLRIGKKKHGLLLV